MQSQSHPTVRTVLRVEPLEDRWTPAAFGSGNLIIYRVGDGSAALTSRATAVFLDEYTPDGEWVQSIALPTTPSGTHKPLVASGNATTEGMLTLSANGEYLVLTGYARSLGGSAAVHAFTSTDVPRVIARVDAKGQVDTSTSTTSFSEGNIRGVASTDGTDLWVIGSNTGVVYTTWGSSGSGTVVSSSVTSLRAVGIFDNQLYVSTASGNAFRIGTVGNGLPTTANQTITNLTGLPTRGHVAGFFFADLNSTIPGVDTLYLVDETNSDAGGLFKYTFDGQSWSLNGQIGGAGSIFRGLTGLVHDQGVTLYLISNGNKLVTFTDTSGYHGTLEGEVIELASAAANTAFRGVAFTPRNPQPLTPYTTNARTKEDVQTTSGLVIIRDPRDAVTTHFKITDITHGTLYFSDGVTVIEEGAFITVAQGEAGLRFTPHSDWNDRIASFGFRVQAASADSDAGLGGEAVWVPIAVEPVNDPPTVILGHAIIEVDQDSGEWEFPQFATFFPGGGPDEAQQTATYHLTNSHTALFAEGPVIDSTGRLHFHLAPGASGSATVSVVVQDSGGTDHDGQDTSEVVTFTIVVKAVANSPPGSSPDPMPEPPPELPSSPPTVAPPAANPNLPSSGLSPPVSTAFSPAPVQFLLLGSGPGMLAVVRVLEARTGEFVRDIVPFVDYQGGVSVAVGDVNGDGMDDWVVGTATHAAHVKVFDGQTGEEILSFIAFERFHGGVSLAVGRGNGQNSATIVVGSATGAAHVKLFRGADALEIGSFYAFENFAGGVRVAAGDTNADSAMEIAVIAATGGQGHLKLFKNGQLKLSTYAFPGFGGPVNVASADVTGQGRAAILAVAQNPFAGVHVKVFTSSGESLASFFVTPPPSPSVGSRRMLEPVPTPVLPVELAAGNLDGDSIAELLVAVPDHRSTRRWLRLDVVPEPSSKEFPADNTVVGNFVYVGI